MQKNLHMIEISCTFAPILKNIHIFMKPICKYCYYYCWVFCLANNGSDFPYDFSHSFCGLHGGCEIIDPNHPIDHDMLNGGINPEFPSAKCGFFPKKNIVPVQLSLF